MSRRATQSHTVNQHTTLSSIVCSVMCTKGRQVEVEPRQTANQDKPNKSKTTLCGGLIACGGKSLEKMQFTANFIQLYKSKVNLIYNLNELQEKREK